MRRGLLVLLCALPLATLCAQEKPFTWDPRQRPKLVAGGRSFYDYEVTSVSQMTLGTAKAESVALSSHTITSESYRWVRHLKSVESGELSEADVKIERWLHLDEGTEDKSLEGKHVTLRKVGPKLKPSLEDDEGVTPKALGWLEGELFRRGGRLAANEAVEELLLPREPAAVTTGTEWTRDPKAVALGFLGTTDVDLQRSHVKGTLWDLRVERGVRYGKARVEAVLQIRKLDMEQLRYEDGVKVELGWTFEGSLEPSRREDATRALRVAFAGRRKLGESLHAETRTERTETLKCGPARK